MQNIRSTGTNPELKIMNALKKRKIYFTKHVKNLLGKPDIVFRKKKVAVFIDSDFWHGNPTRFIMPKSNISYWSNKITSNIIRDKKVNKVLSDNGWNVLRFWEYDVNKNLEYCIQKILTAIDFQKS